MSEEYPGCASISKLFVSVLVLILVLLLLNYGEAILDRIPYISKEYIQKHKREVLGSPLLIQGESSEKSPNILLFTSSNNKTVVKEITKNLPEYINKKPKNPIESPLLLIYKPLNQYANIWETALPEVPSANYKEVIFFKTSHLFLFIWKNNVWALGKKNGQMLWQKSFESEIIKADVELKNLVVFLKNGELQVLNSSSGKHQWTKSTDLRNIQSLKIITGKINLVYQKTKGNFYLQQINLSNPKQTLDLPKNHEETNINTWIKAEKVFFLSKKNQRQKTLQAWNLKTGQLLWKQDLPKNLEIILFEKNLPQNIIMDKNFLYLKAKVLNSAEQLLRFNLKNGKYKILLNELETTLQPLIINEELILTYAQPKEKNSKAEIWGVLKDDGEVIWRHQFRKKTHWFLEINLQEFYLIEISEKSKKLVFKAINIDTGKIIFLKNNEIEETTFQDFKRVKEQIILNLGSLYILDLETGNLEKNYP